MIPILILFVEKYFIAQAIDDNDKYDMSITKFKDIPSITEYIEAMPTLISKHLNYNKSFLLEKVTKNKISFNHEQKLIFNTIETALNTQDNLQPKANLYFVGGCGGSGKTFLYNTLLAKVRSEGNIAIGLASSGIASLLIDDGHTAHSTLKIPFRVNNRSFCDIGPKSSLAELIRQTKLFVWDEAPMMSKDVYETVDRSFREIMKSVNPELNDIPFGGKLFLFSGDFKQLLPIVRHGSKSSVLQQCMNKSIFWSQVKCLKLKINMRLKHLNEYDASNQKKFGEYLLNIGNGTEPVIDLNYTTELPKDLCIDSDDPILISWVYNNFKENIDNKKYLTDRAILCTTNNTVNIINTILLNMIPGNEQHLLSTDTPIQEGQTDNYPIEFLNGVKLAGLPAHDLILKPRSIVVLMRNLNLSEGLSNGTRLFINKVSRHVIDVEILTGKNKGKNVFIPRITIMPDESECPFPFKRQQFPVKLAFGLTINKSQGQTINKLGLFIDSRLFYHGHLYTAMSRVSEKNAIK